MTVEERFAEWEKQPGAKVSQAERNFIDDLRHYAAQGVGYGWMQQVIEWEWQAKDPTGAFGPEYFEKHRAEQVASNGWEKANHREESLARAIHALPGTEWTFWVEVEGVMYAHRHTLPFFHPSQPHSGEGKK